jgi:hypothetical protein
LSKRVRKLLIAVAAVCVAAVVLLGIVAVMAKSSPGFYRPPRVGAPEFEASAKRMEDKLIELRNLTAETQAAVARGELGDRYVLTITQDELNSFMLKWAELNALRDQYEKYARNPMVAFEPGKVILAAESTAGPVDCVVSIHLAAAQNDANLKLAVEHVQAGRLTVPQRAWAGQLNRVVRELERQLPAWRTAARFDRAGAANESAAKAALATLLLSSLQSKPADARVVIPVSGSRGIAVRISALKVEQGQITLTLAPLTAAERATWLDALKAPR